MIADRKKDIAREKRERTPKEGKIRPAKNAKGCQKERQLFYVSYISCISRAMSLIFILRVFRVFLGHAFLSETVGAEFLAFEHLDGEGDGVDLVVVFGVGEYADFVEQVIMSWLERMGIRFQSLTFKKTHPLRQVILTTIKRIPIRAKMKYQVTSLTKLS